LIPRDNGAPENKIGFELLNSGLGKYVEDKTELSKFKSNDIKEIKNLENLTNFELLAFDSQADYLVRGSRNNS
jgi:hypothetical protein